MPSGRFKVVQSQTHMIDDLAAIQQASFPNLAADELFEAKHYASHIKVFPEGQFAVIDQEMGRVVASSTDLIMAVNLNHFQHTFIDAVDNLWLTSHNPEGDWLYGADIGVHPEYRGFKLSNMLYAARHNLIRKMNLKGHVAGAMPKGFHLYPNFSIEQYLHKVLLGEIRDPVVSVQLKRGYHLWGIIENYLDDHTCGNYGAYIMWRNPEYKA